MEGSTGGERCPIRFKDTGKVFRMYCVACSPVLQLIDRPAKILDDWAIDRFEFAARGHDCNEPRYPVNCCPKLRLALPQCLLGTLALDELTDLAADGSQHVEQLQIGLP